MAADITAIHIDGSRHQTGDITPSPILLPQCDSRHHSQPDRWQQCAQLSLRCMTAARSVTGACSQQCFFPQERRVVLGSGCMWPARYVSPLAARDLLQTPAADLLTSHPLPESAPDASSQLWPHHAAHITAARSRAAHMTPSA